ncbi:hypothetical protein D9758_006398 [Tetrapyrgos nigripes]|uniref:AB hydrolase-1 domain-containing protein n=1 Tax=Tetrapyrgos nigripes TaxID=182062 RepID=A0A8H5D8G5_9AGAR|nr:hypothetical protein D9758_006398 [Tetrapyrgos nigripes]
MLVSAQVPSTSSYRRMNDDSVWLPIYPPPENPSFPKPDLPSPPREPFWKSLSSHPAYSLSTHIIPAAFLRSTPEIDLPCPPHSCEGKKTRQNSIREGVDRLWELRRKENDRRLQLGAPIKFERRLWLCLNRYVRKDVNSKNRRHKGLTLFCAHANGFNKETWEPMIYHLLSSPAGNDIEEIWVWESIQHGDSGLLNAGRLSSLFHWFDGTRDLLNFLIYFLPTTITATLPVHLPRVPPEESTRRLQRGLSRRTLIAVGHSLGGSLISRACLSYPQFFSALALVDPVIIPLSEPILWKVLDGMATGAFGRRTSWPSRESAYTSLAISPFFKPWHPDVLRLYVEGGLYPTSPSPSPCSCFSGSPVEYKLKLDAITEATVFTDTITGCADIWDRFHEIDENIEIKWIMPGDYDGLVNRKSTKERVNLRPANSSHVTIPGCGHLIAQEKPKELAEEIANFVTKYAEKKAKL